MRTSFVLAIFMVLLAASICCGASASFNQGSSPLPINVALSGSEYQGAAWAAFTGTASTMWLVNLTKYDADIQHMGINGEWVEEAYVSEETDQWQAGTFSVHVISTTESNNPALWISIYWDEDRDGTYDGDEEFMCGAWAYTY